MRASELLLIVRAQNQASSALRRVAGDLRGLSAVSGLRQRGQALSVARQQIMLGRQIAANELASIETGKRAQEMAMRRSAAEIGLMRAQQTRSNIDQQVRRREASLALNEANRARQMRRIQSAATPSMLKDAQLRFKAAAIQAEILAEQQRVLARSTTIADAAISKQTARLHALAAAEAEAANRASVLRQRIANYGDRLRMNTSQIEDNNRAINRARWDRVAAGGRIFQHTSRVMEYAGLVLGGSLAFMAKNAADFQTQVTYAATQTRKAGQSFVGTAANAKILQRDILGLMTEFPQQADDFSAAAYDLYSSTSVSFGQGRRLLKLFAQAGVAGMTDVKTATNAGIVVLNNFGNSVERMPQLLQRMFAGVRFGRMTFQDFATSMATIGPAARAANQSFDEMVGTFAFLTRHLDVAKARVGFARILEVLASPKMLAGLKQQNIQIQDSTHHLLPLHEIIGRILERFPKLRRGGTDAMNFFKNIGGLQGTIQARRAFTFLVQFFDRAGKDGASYLDMLQKVKKDNNEFTQSLQAMEKTTGVRWGVFVNQLKALALAFGAEVIPALLKLRKPIESLINWWQNLDDATRGTIGRFATYSAVFLLVGGAVAFLGGTVIRLFAVFGRFLGLGAGIGATFATIGLIVAALTGHIRALGDVLTVISNFTFGSFTGFAITLGIATAAAIRLTGALRGLAATEGAIGGGGLLAGLLGRGRNVRAGASLAREAIASKGAIAGIAASAALIPGPLWIAAGAIVAGVGGLYLWKRHMDDIRKDAEAIKQAAAMGAAPRREFDVFQQLPKSVEDIRRTQISLNEMRRSLADLRKEASGATGRRRLELLDQIELQTLDIADAQEKLQQANARANRQFDAYTAGLARFIPAAQKVRALQQQLHGLEEARARAPLTPGIDDVIEQTRKRLRALTSEMRTSASGLQRVFSGVVNQLAKIGQIPRPSRGVIADMFNISKQVGRALTIPEMKAVIRAEVDPRARRDLPAQIRAIFSRVSTQRIKIEADARAAKRAAANFARQLGTTPAKLRAILQPFGRDVKGERDKAAKILTPLHQKVMVDPPPNLGAIGAQISAGIQAGMQDVEQRVIIQKIVQPIQKALQIHSPSLLMAEKVGKPISQGIALGILQAAGEIEKAAMITMDLFQGAVLSKLDGKKKPTAQLLIKDLQSQLRVYRQFNAALARLARRGVPKELIDQLAALGPEAAAKIALLSRMSAPQLRRYVQLWQAANREVKRSMRTTQEDIKRAMKEMTDNMVQKLMDTYNQFRDINVQNFGALFQGPTNLDQMVGENFKAAMEEYRSQADDLRKQIADAYGQIADAQREAAQRLADAIQQRKEELQQQFGQLFSGDWMSGTIVQTRIEWGKKLGFEDLQKDLESQVEKFKRWRADLTSLAGKVPPELAKQLEALGPEAVDKLDILDKATDEQLAKYVTTWMQGQSQIAAVASKTTVDTSDITARIGDILVTINDLTAKLGALRMPHEITGEDIIADLKAQQDQWLEYSGILQDLLDKGLPLGLIQQLQQMGPEALPYLRALNTMSDTQLAELAKIWDKNQELIHKSTIDMLNTQLALWYQYGKNIAINIIAGIRSESPGLEKFFRDLIQSMLRSMGGGVPSYVPSDTPSNGEKPPFPVDGGYTPKRPTGVTEGMGASSITVERGAIHVEAYQSESLQSTLERAAFRLMTKVPG